MKRSVAFLFNIMLCVVAAGLLTGCGNESETAGGPFYAPSCMTDLNVKKTSADRILLNILSDRFLAARPESRGIDNNLLYRDKDSAFCKRKASGELAVYLYNYKLLNYDISGDLSWNFLVAMRLDAYSNFNYNLGALCLVPRKIIISPRVSTSFFGWIGNIIVVLFDACLALVMLFVGPIIGMICHPFESLANIIAGVLYIPEYGFEQYKGYILNVNFVASVWDTLKLLFYVVLHTLFFWVL